MATSGEKTSPFLEIKFGWDKGSDDWNYPLDEDLVKFSYMFDRNIDGIVSTLPAVVNGQAYFNTQDNRLYFAVDGTYYSAPTPKWFEVVNRADGIVYRFTGTDLEVVESAAAIDARLDAVELVVASLSNSTDVAKGDALIAVKQPFTGAVARTQHDKNQDYLTLQDFGAVGDGATNDDSAFTAFEAQFSHLDVDLRGKTYVVSGDKVANKYYNGTLKTPTLSIVKSLPERGSPQVTGISAGTNAGLFFYASNLQGPGGNNIGVQSFAFDERTRNIYTLQLNGAGSGNLSTVNRFSLDGTISQASLGYSTPVSADVGHQGLGLEYLTGTDFRLWTTGYTSSKQAVRYSYTDGGPLSNIELYTLFGSDFAENTSCTPTISYGQQFLIAYGTRTGASTTTVRVFRLSDLVSAGAGDYSNKWVYQWDTQGLVDSTHPTQGIASDGISVWLLAGVQDITLPKRLQTYTLNGQLISSDEDFRVGRAEAALDGTGVVYEPEGLSLLRVGPSLMLCVGVLSGDIGTRYTRIYALGLKEPLHTNSLLLDGNFRYALSSSSSAGRDFAKIGAVVDGGTSMLVYGPNDASYPNKVGWGLGGLTPTSVVMGRTGDNITLESTIGEMRLNAPTGTAVRLQIANGSLITANSTGITFYQPLIPTTTGTLSVGSATRFLLGSFVTTRYYTATVFDAVGTGTPEGAVVAGIGSTFRRTDGGASTTFYVKQSGTGNTGWVAK